MFCFSVPISACGLGGEVIKVGIIGLDTHASSLPNS